MDGWTARIARGMRLRVLFVLAPLLAHAASVEASDFYVGGGFDLQRYADQHEIAALAQAVHVAHLGRRNFDVSQLSLSESQTNAKAGQRLFDAAFGWRANHFLALEVGLYNTLKAKAVLAGSLESDGATLPWTHSIDIKSRATALRLLGTLPVGAGFSVYGAVGLTRVRTNIRADFCIDTRCQSTQAIIPPDDNNDGIPDYLEQGGPPPPNAPGGPLRDSRTDSHVSATYAGGLLWEGSAGFVTLEYRPAAVPDTFGSTARSAVLRVGGALYFSALGD